MVLKAMRQRATAGGIGHNQPPAPIDDDWIDEDTLDTAIYAGELFSRHLGSSGRELDFEVIRLCGRALKPVAKTLPYMLTAIGAIASKVAVKLIADAIEHHDFSMLTDDVNFVISTVGHWCHFAGLSF